uniref:Uncharacterized protein n=1 Tax=Setaria italica TaxID=4555 RepID=K3XP98_SETIT
MCFSPRPKPSLCKCTTVNHKGNTTCYTTPHKEGKEEELKISVKIGTPFLN